MKPCIMCGTPTKNPMPGQVVPYICRYCDAGILPNGQRFTADDGRAYYVRVGEWRRAWIAGNPDQHFEPIFKNEVRA